ncbi:MAG: hypothetical protein K9N46_04140 [Candidatus Marinimicrobia bacterium]|nr:hypothetical protein [Candidatus Neomarinimicrobiota bacterium]MCF7828953.1 hypothetical protein [Candidatus Neomarinimicrobiota bacterium]MCF7879913.1 hypothetical protein [Candidatus Neomarinimicrobiota bacterium]
MKGKVLVILGLLALLAFTVYKMIQHETEIREERVVREYISDDSGPLIERKSSETLRRIANRADYRFRTSGDYFSKLEENYPQSEPQWNTFLVKGVNLGFALPGQFPAEFAMTYDHYMDWLKQIGQMNANVIRVYTILPPVFYEAFANYNLHHQDKPLYLFQGVWATEPTAHNYTRESYTRNFKREIMDAIDVLHGNAVLEEEVGKASGAYAIDVSDYVAGIMLGREWEPNGVHTTIQEDSINYYFGDFISMPDGNAMEAWLAEVMDFTVLYETQTYQSQHPVSFVNWLPLDPMYHDTEIIESEEVREYDNDLESVDFTRFHSSELFRPGVYATYHVYPYYPDFIYLEDQYAGAEIRAAEPDNFIGYLNDLKSEHEGMPLVIAEYGVPSSRGVSHINPYGLDQGGHSESEQAEISMMLTRDIYHAGCAGAIFFEWADEWFKHNWLVMGFETPFHDRKLWHNMENPEQNFGILAMESRQRTIDGNFTDWGDAWKSAGTMRYQFHADPSYFYMAMEFDSLDFTRHNLRIPVDTYDRQRGDHRLPFTDQRFARGFEFLTEFFSPDSAHILVDEPYSVYSGMEDDSGLVFTSEPNENGLFIPQKLLTNRGRISLTGEKFDSVIVNRSPLQFGKSNEPETSNASWYWNAETRQLELRLTWHLLNVSDPAKNYVLDDTPGTPAIEYTETDGFKFKVFVTDKKESVLKHIPEDGYLFYLWEKWESPSWTSRLKPLYDSLKTYFGEVTSEDIASTGSQLTSGEEEFTICEFYGNHSGAVSFSFQGADYSQVKIGKPVLEKYGTTASFGVIPGFVNSTPARYQLDNAGQRRRLTTQNIQMLRNNGHVLALQLREQEESAVSQLRTELRQNTGMGFNLLFTHDSEVEIPDGIEFVRNVSPGMKKYSGTEFYNIDGNSYSTNALDSVLRNRPDEWIILNYRYLTEDIESTRAQSLFMTGKQFEWHVRLARNKRFWLADEWDVFRYRKERQASDIRTFRHNDNVFLNIDTPLNTTIYDHPLTIRYTTDAPYIRVKNATEEYTLRNRTGEVYFNIIPGNEITLTQVR